MKEEFELWCQTQFTLNLNFHQTSTGYQDPAVQAMWIGYQGMQDD